jgi:hypothetical protein
MTIKMTPKNSVPPTNKSNKQIFVTAPLAFIQKNKSVNKEASKQQQEVEDDSVILQYQEEPILQISDVKERKEDVEHHDDEDSVILNYFPSVTLGAQHPPKAPLTTDISEENFCSTATIKGSDNGSPRLRLLTKRESSKDKQGITLNQPHSSFEPNEEKDSVSNNMPLCIPEAIPPKFSSTRRRARRPPSTPDLSPESKRLQESDAVTRKNTLKNSGFKLVDISLQLVKYDTARPPSPDFIRSTNKLAESLGPREDVFSEEFLGNRKVFHALLTDTDDLPALDSSFSRRLKWPSASSMLKVLEFKAETSVLALQKEASFSKNPSAPKISIKPCLKKTQNLCDKIEKQDGLTKTTIPVSCTLYKNDDLERFIGLTALPGGKEVFQRIIEEVPPPPITAQRRKKQKFIVKSIVAEKPQQSKDASTNITYHTAAASGHAIAAKNSNTANLGQARKDILGKRTGLKQQPERRIGQQQPVP